MRVTMAPRAYWRLQWLCHRTENEVSTMGVLAPERNPFEIGDVILVKQEVSPVHVDLDMTWWADKQVELYEDHGIQPWQTSVWIHTHPSGVRGPSSIDLETMEGSFGAWSFAIMLVLTRDGQFYARLDFDHEFSGGCLGRFQVPCKVDVAWSEAGGLSVSSETVADWENEFQELVTVSGEVFRGRTKSRSKKPRNTRTQADSKVPFAEEFNDREEVEDYVESCRQYGMDPSDPDSFEAFFGYWPEHDGFSQIETPF